MTVLRPLLPLNSVQDPTPFLFRVVLSTSLHRGYQFRNSLIDKAGPEIYLSGKPGSCLVGNMNHHTVLKIGSFRRGRYLGQQVRVQEEARFSVLSVARMWAWPKAVCV